MPRPSTRKEPINDIFEASLLDTPSIEVSLKWDHWLGLAYNFYNGAKFHFQEGSFNAALFCLHQSAECVLVALVRAVLEYDINNHNLSRLLSITQIFSEDVVLVFDLESEQGKLLFNELKHAYVNVRYKDGYVAERNAVERLIEIVKQLMGIAEGLYQKHMLTSNL
jgi:HEPN domain-containing protein